MAIKKLKEMFMKKDSKYQLLEDRLTQLENIIDDMVADIQPELEEEECITILPYEIIEKIEKAIRTNINVIGIT
jgi:hypothetical protein